MNKKVVLNKNSQFRRLYSKGKSSVQPSVVVYAKRNGFSYNRIGLTVRKKIGKAVTRNLVKRRLRAVFRDCGEMIKTGYDFVLVSRVRTPVVRYDRLKADFIAAIKEVGAFSEIENAENE